mmetsp:Transcript_3651/g.7623  ORF Transcript_3651/g.7623 Transcript_3651/m.7623 type:complete len:110 (-) Transcript_3651:180-509(-)
MNESPLHAKAREDFFLNQDIRIANCVGHALPLTIILLGDIIGRMLAHGLNVKRLSSVLRHKIQFNYCICILCSAPNGTSFFPFFDNKSWISGELFIFFLHSSQGLTTTT